MSSDAKESTGDKPSLPKLLASLALGARSVNALPFGKENNDDDDDDDDDDDGEEDEFSFRMSLPEFSSLNNEARQLLSSLLGESLEGLSMNDANDGDNDKSSELYEFDDPELWDKCADACDALHERVTNYISNEQGKQKSGDPAEYETLATAISNVAHCARSLRRIHGWSRSCRRLCMMGIIRGAWREGSLRGRGLIMLVEGMLVVTRRGRVMM